MRIFWGEPPSFYRTAEVLAERIETLAYQEYRAASRPRTEKLARTLENAGLRQDAAIFRGWLRH